MNETSFQIGVTMMHVSACACVCAEGPAASSLLKTLFCSLKPYQQDGEEEEEEEQEHAQLGPSATASW